MVKSIIVISMTYRKNRDNGKSGTIDKYERME